MAYLYSAQGNGSYLSMDSEKKKTLNHCGQVTRTSQSVCGKIKCIQSRRLHPFRITLTQEEHKYTQVHILYI